MWMMHPQTVGDRNIAKECPSSCTPDSCWMPRSCCKVKPTFSKLRVRPKLSKSPSKYAPSAAAEVNSSSVMGGSPACAMQWFTANKPQVNPICTPAGPTAPHAAWLYLATQHQTTHTNGLHQHTSNSCKAKAPIRNMHPIVSNTSAQERTPPTHLELANNTLAWSMWNDCASCTVRWRSALQRLLVLGWALDSSRCCRKAWRLTQRLGCGPRLSLTLAFAGSAACKTGCGTLRCAHFTQLRQSVSS